MNIECAKGEGTYIEVSRLQWFNMNCLCCGLKNNHVLKCFFFSDRKAKLSRLYFFIQIVPKWFSLSFIQ